MKDRRKIDVNDPHLKEDRGIFKTGAVQVTLDVTPLRRNTSRGDVLCIGFLKDVEVDVIIPGRRRRDCTPLLAHLDDLIKSANAAATKQRRPAPPPTSIRLALAAEGVWRVRTEEEDNLRPERRYQFLMSCWTLNGRRFGDAPLR